MVLGFRNFRATVRCSRVSSARYTIPIPPAPNASSTSKWETRAAGRAASGLPLGVSSVEAAEFSSELGESIKESIEVAEPAAGPQRPRRAAPRPSGTARDRQCRALPAAPAAGLE